MSLSVVYTQFLDPNAVIDGGGCKGVDSTLHHNNPWSYPSSISSLLH